MAEWTCKCGGLNLADDGPTQRCWRCAAPKSRTYLPAVASESIDAARWRALVKSVPSQEWDMSTGPGSPKTMILKIDCSGCERYLESGAPDFAGTLAAAMDDEIRRHSLSGGGEP